MDCTIYVGSKNLVKVSAVRECAVELSLGADVIGADIDSGVSEQPQSLDETFLGAKNRAFGALVEGSLGVGIEDGLFALPGKEKTYMNICVCALTDGKDTFYGCSSAFEYPHEITEAVFEEGLDISQALNKAGYTENPQIGAAEGAIGILSQGRLVRKDYTRQAVAAAFIHIEKFKRNVS